MVTHVGLNPQKGKLSYYSDLKKRIISLQITEVKHDEAYKINQMFEEIISKIDEIPGCICIYSTIKYGYGNEIRKKFVEEGLRHGFKNVEFINDTVASYLNAMSQVTHIPLNDDIIWMILGVKIFIWKINGQKAEFIYYDIADCSILEDLKTVVNRSKLNRGPDVVLGNFDGMSHKSKVCEAEIAKISDCKFFCYSVQNFECNGCLIRARITAGESEVLHLDATNLLSVETSLYLGNKETNSFLLNQIITFPQFHQLPIDYLYTVKKKQNFDVLTIATGVWKNESFEIPK